MANLKSYNYKGWGTWVSKKHPHVQAIRVGDRIFCSGQGGWLPHETDYDFDNLIVPDLNEEIDRAFANVEVNLKDAGGKGWSQVYRVVTYSTNIAAQNERIVYNLRKWMPDSGPVWTELGVSHLASPLMNIEIDVEAYDPEGAKEARKE